MSTISIARKINIDENICQGDVFTDVQYNYIDCESNDSVEIVQYTFPMAMIISQACDVISMSEMTIGGAGMTTKFMPSVLMCPIYDADNARQTNHINTVFKELQISKLDDPKTPLINKKEMEIINKDWHYRYHSLSVKIGKESVLDDAIIDFKHYFTVPTSYLIRKRENRIFNLGDIYAEQITLKFATYLSRVAIPN